MQPRPAGVRVGVGRPPPSSSSSTLPPAAPSPRPRDATPSAGSRIAHSPLDSAGKLCDASDRPLLCCSLQGNEMIVGSADHALYCYDAATGRPTRRLYGKRHGHIDWVSTTTHLPDGRILSGGGDGKLCLWPRAPQTRTNSLRPLPHPLSASSSAASVPTATCLDLDGHASAVSKVAAVPESARLAFSAGYDGTVKLWDTQARRLLTSLDVGRPTSSSGALDPVVDFAFGPAHLLSGARSGTLRLWDLASGALLCSARAAHRGQVTCVLSSSASGSSSGAAVFVTGGQDGQVKVWDTRANTLASVHQVECHASAARGTTAAVACLEDAGAFLCSGGADGRLCVLEPRAGYQPVHVFDHHRAPMCALKAEGQVLFSGGGDGMLLCHDLKAMALCYGLHANRGAVRCLAVSKELGSVVAAGDDGKAIVYSY